MISVTEAKKKIADHIELMPPVTVALHAATGAVLAEKVSALVHVPPFDNAAMDGFAFRHTAGLSHFRITQKIRAGGVSNSALGAGEAARIFTGAPIPEGADTVVQQELTQVEDDRIELDPAAVVCGANVRLAGAQCRAGDTIADAGSLIRPGAVGLFASAGVARVRVYAVPSVAVITTGDEVRTPGADLQPGEIFNANAPVLRAYLQQTGIKDFHTAHVADSLHFLKEKIGYCLEQFDVLLLSGGVSVGAYDYVPSALAANGVTPLFYKVKQKPGKPLYVGKKGRKWIFALPGNPAAVVSCFTQYVKPCLKALQGHRHVFEPDCRLPLANSYQKNAALTYFLKAKMENDRVRVLPGQDSFNLLPFSEADCLVEAEEQIELVEYGTMVSVYKL